MIWTGQAVPVGDFISYLIAKKVSSTCTCCGHEHSFVSADTNEANAAQTRMDVVTFDAGSGWSFPRTSGAILAFSTVCNNCGYIKQFASQNVYEWLKSRVYGPGDF